MAGVPKSKWSSEAKAAFAAKGNKKGIKPNVSNNLGASGTSSDVPPTILASPPIITASIGPTNERPQVAETPAIETIVGPDISQVEKEKKAKSSKATVDVQAAMEMAPGLVKLVSDGVGYTIQSISSADAIPFQANYTPISNEMADAFCKANKATLERYLPGWYKDSPLFMLAISFGAMQVAALEFSRKPKRVEPPTQQEQMQNRIVQPPPEVPAVNQQSNPNAPPVLEVPKATASLGLV